MVPKYDTNEAWRTMARWKSALNLISSFRETAIIHLTEGFRHVFKPCVHTLTDNERKHFRTLEKKVTQSCLTLCDPMDYTVHGILQARILERVAFPFSRRKGKKGLYILHTFPKLFYSHGISPKLLQHLGEGNGNPLQCSWLEIPRDGGAQLAAIYGVAQSQTRLKQLSSSSSSSSNIYYCNLKVIIFIL